MKRKLEGLKDYYIVSITFVSSKTLEWRKRIL